MRNRDSALPGTLMVALGLAIVVALAFAAAPALAAQKHVFSSSFGEPCPAAPCANGQLTLAEHSGLAVNQESGDLYVADTGNGRIQQFSSTGTFIRAFGSFTTPTFLAVDNSSGSSKGNVYVADTANATVSKFQADGTPITSWGTGGVLDGSSSANGPFALIGGIAVGSTGTLYVYNEGPEGGGRIFEFGQDGSPATQFAVAFGVNPAGIAVDSAGNIYVVRISGAVAKVDPTGATLSEEVDPGPTTGLASAAGDEVYVAHPGAINRYSSSGASLESFGAADLTAAAGLAVAANRNAYIADAGAGEVDLFTTLVVPDAVTEAPTPVGKNSATLHGTVGAAGGPPASCEFQYTPEATFEAEGFQGASSAPCVPPGPFSGTGQEAVAAQLSGLQAGSAYRYRVLGSNENGADPGAAELFTTLPAVSLAIGQASAVTRVSATLNATVNPEGLELEECRFEYGPGEELNLSAPCAESPAEIGAVQTPVAVHADVSGLTASAPYSFRIAATNSFGTAKGSTESFTTLPAVNLKTAKASNLAPTSATLNGTIDPEGLELESCEFEYFANEALQTVPCAESPAEIGSGQAPVSVHADIAGLTANGEYPFLLLAINSLGTSEGEVETFETFGPPTIAGESASEITDTTAKLSAQINPHGEATDFQVQYVAAADFLENGYADATSLPVPPEGIGSGTGLIEVAQQLSGLVPETTYHFRIIATNAAGPPVLGANRTFTTFVTAVPGLPDGRAYEMVSPAQKSGEVFTPNPYGGSCNNCLPGFAEQHMPMQSSPDGESVLYEGQPFSAGSASGGNEYLSTRNPSGWGTQSLNSPLIQNDYQAFSPDLSRGVLHQVEPTLSPEAPTREGRSFANLYIWQDGTLRPVLTKEPPNRDPGEVGKDHKGFSITYAGANSGTTSSPAFAHLVFQANDALSPTTPTAPAAEDGGVVSDEFGAPANLNLYEWFEGQLRLINVLPGNASAPPGAVIGSGRLLLDRRSEAPVVDHAISADGSRVFWTSEGNGQVYVRIDGKETLEVPGPGRCKESLPLEERVCFLTASADGSQVLLSDGQIFKLNEAGTAYEPTADLSKGQGGFRGILGAAEDLSRVYFVDAEALTEESEENANGEHAEAEKPNLYAWHGGAIVFVATLNNEGRGAWQPSRSARSAQVSPDGTFLAFSSVASLTGYDNTVSGGGEVAEIFEYDAASARLTCASCNPTGQQPLGGSNLSFIEEGPDYPPLPQPGNLSTGGNGRLFFESQDALSPNDANGHIQDVYEWEPNEVGNCPRPAGCVSLISSGHSPNDSFFLDSTPSGNDAFIITREQLLARDKDDLLDLYDARVGGGIEEVAAASCLEAACKDPIPAPPVQQGSGSSTFNGPANQKQKHHKHKKKSHRHKSKNAHQRSAKHNSGGSK